MRKSIYCKMIPEKLLKENFFIDNEGDYWELEVCRDYWESKNNDNIKINLDEPKEYMEAIILIDSNIGKVLKITNDNDIPEWGIEYYLTEETHPEMYV